MSTTTTHGNSPLVTVILPVHNAATFVGSAIESILSQTFSDFELLIINDGSTDHSAEIISSFNDPRITLINNERNLGLIVSLNKGIQLAKGKYIARMDADDIALPQRFKKQVEKMESDPGIAVLASFVDFINEDGEITGSWNTDREAASEKEIRDLMARTNCIAHPTVMMRSDVANDFFYRQNQKGAEDWDLWLRILGDGKRITKLPEVLLHYRIHPASITGKDKIAEPLEKRLMRVKRKFIFGQLAKLKINGFYIDVKISWLKNFARHLVSNKFPEWGRNLKRYVTSPPWKVISQGKVFRLELKNYRGRHFFVFPYMHVGGAEKVHAAIVASVADQKPLVIFSNFSDNDHFLNRFKTNAIVLDVAHYVNYPLTRKKAKQLLTDAINKTNNAVFFGSNAGLFYDLVPSLNNNVKAIDLIHAFKYQPGANLAHLKLISLASRIDARIFVSGAAKEEFEKFAFHNNIPKRLRDRLIKITNGIMDEGGIIKPLTNEPGVLFVGRNSPEKRMELFLRIAKEMPSSFRFKLVGASNPGGDSPVRFYGELNNENEIKTIYSENDFLLLTSSREGFPMVIMEAMMAGLIVISTPVGDIPNHLNGENGIVTSSADPEIVVEEMKKILNELVQSPQRVLQIKAAAKKYAQQNFSEAKFVQHYRELLGANS
ncbi:MAG: glycosyltransferase [Bacteroidota bacterium]|nr:glycosyltransferase [Bacteroidota bacterium]